MGQRFRGRQPPEWAAAVLLAAAVLIGAAAATIGLSTTHPQSGDSSATLNIRACESAARLADALDGFGTNQLQAVP